MEERTRGPWFVHWVAIAATGSEQPRAIVHWQGFPLRSLMALAMHAHTSHQPVLSRFSVSEVISLSSIGRKMQHRPRLRARAVFSLLVYISPGCAFEYISTGCRGTGETDDDNSWAPWYSWLGNREPFCDAGDMQCNLAKSGRIEWIERTERGMRRRGYTGTSRIERGRRHQRRTKLTGRGNQDSFVAWYSHSLGEGVGVSN
ncbi:hypothetical protein HAV15_011581 [Penicillium sp. str. |nr:hypothetical protein HAV15_011581 [Penicillium sp. str. \